MRRGYGRVHCGGKSQDGAAIERLPEVSERCGDVCDGAEEHEWIVLRRRETSPPKFSGLVVDDRTSIKSANPSGLMRTCPCSMTTSSAARTAASRTNSVRERARRLAARSIIATSAAGRRIAIGYSLLSTVVATAHLLARKIGLLYRQMQYAKMDRVHIRILGQRLSNHHRTNTSHLWSKSRPIIGSFRACAIAQPVGAHNAVREHKMR